MRDIVQSRTKCIKAHLYCCMHASECSTEFPTGANDKFFSLHNFNTRKHSNLQRKAFGSSLATITITHIRWRIETKMPHTRRGKKNKKLCWGRRNNKKKNVQVETAEAYKALYISQRQFSLSSTIQLLTLLRRKIKQQQPDIKCSCEWKRKKKKKIFFVNI